MKRIRGAWAAFRQDRRGVSAIEFAFIVPMVMIAYFGMSELSSAMMAQRRTSHVSSALGDLAAQFKTLQSSDVANIFAAAQIIMQPFPTGTLQLRLTSITQQSTGKATVDWSDVSGSGISGYAKGTVMSGLPAGLLVNTGDSIIMSEAKYTYVSPVTYMLPGTMNFSDNFYLRPRYGTTITCTGC